jgi:hypothetical protein
MVWGRDGNAVILGPTQNGKTTVANERHKTTKKIGVFYNHDDEPFITGHATQSVEGMLQLFDRGKSKIDFQLPMFSTEPEEQLEKLVRTLMILGEKKGGVFRLSIDEAHEIAYEGSNNTPVHLAMKRGQKRGVYVNAITQDPATFSKSAARQADYLVWVGPMSGSTKEYFKRQWDFPEKGIEKIANVNQYHYKAINRQGEVVDSGPTK